MEGEAVTQSRLIGAILVENGLISRDQLLRALELQAETGERLGEIVVAEFGVPRIELASVLAEQWAALEGNPTGEPPKPAPTLRVVAAPAQGDSAIRRPIGEIFLELGFITQAQLDAALDVQRTTGARIGEILVEQGSLTRLDLASALAEQWSSLEKLRPPSPSASDLHVSPLRDGSAQRDVPAADSGALSALEGRLSALESTPGADATPGAAEIEAGIVELRNALAALDQKIDEVSATRTAADELADVTAVLGARIDALEQHDVSGELATLRKELEEVVARPDATEAVAGLHAAIERLEERPDASSQIEALAAEIAVLSARLDDRTTIGELETMVEAVAGQAEAVGGEVRQLSERLETLSSLGDRLDELAARVPAEGAVDALVEQFRRDLAEIDVGQAETAGADDAAVASLSARVEQLALRLDEIVSTPEPELETLASRVEATAALSATLADGLGERIASLEETAREGRGALDRLASELEVLGSRTQEQLSELGGPSGDSAAFDDLQRRLEELAASVERVPDAARLEDIDARVAALAEQRDSIGSLETRLRELEGRIPEVASATELRGEIRSALESATAERASLSQELMTRVEEMTASGPRGDELAEVRERLDELASLSHEDAALRERVDAMSARLDSVGALEAEIVAARDQIAAAEALRVADALAIGARLAGVEASTASHLQALADLDGRLADLAADLGWRSDDDSLTSDVADLRARIANVATQESTDALGRRVSEVVDRAEAIAEDIRSSLTRLADELNGRVDEFAHGLDARIDELAERLGGLVAREEGARDESIRAVRSELREHHHALASQLQAQLAEQRTELDRVRAERDVVLASTARLESLLEQGLADLSTRMTEEIAGARAAAEHEVGIVRGETASLGSRIDEILGMREVDLQGGRSADERLAEQLDAIAEQRENDAEAARREAAELSSRLDGVAGALEAETAAVRAIAEGMDGQLGDLRRRRLEDMAAAELAGAELAARLDDLALRTAESTFEVERGIRDEILALSARVEGRDAEEIEAREELRSELERLASSMGWRLERIEESLASDDSRALRETVADLERRLEGQSALGEQQVKATERALRKGLAALGERLVESESAYVEAGNTLRRSIERLGAAVVEADARMADQIPVSPLEGCVAFAPTADGYRLIELPGAPPEVGAVVELEACQAPLVVTRYGRSPLPFDGRPCAYLDRA